ASKYAGRGVEEWCQEQVNRCSGRNRRGVNYDRCRYDEARLLLSEARGPGVVELRLGEEARAERQSFVHLKSRTEVRGNCCLRRLQVHVSDVRAWRDSQLPEHRRLGPRGDWQDARWHRRGCEVDALVQLHLPQHDIEAAADREPRRQLISERGLDVDRLENVLVTGEPAVECRGPVGLEPVGCEQADADAELGCSRV